MFIEGDYTTAEIKLPEEHIEDSLIDEIREMTDSPGFRNPVKFMPDVHGGLGPHAIVGFTMELQNRVIPNTVGGDIGCGLLAVKLDSTDVDFTDIDDLRDVNNAVRDAVPMGTGRVHSRDTPLAELYPWEDANNTLKQYFEYRNQPDSEQYSEHTFDQEYFEDLCRRVGISETYAANSLGSLGSGNHFIEIAKSQQTDETWLVIHSGSRKLGQKVAGYHQQKATEHRDNEVAWSEMSDTQRKYAHSDGSPDWDAISRDFDGKKIEELGAEIETFTADSDRNKKVDYLEGEEMFPYLKDMVFAQQYATTNRILMAEAVADVLNATIVETIDSPHNYVDFRDGVVRKGSTRAHESEQFVIPMNMEEGTLLCRGKGNKDWNKSAPHGAGRLGSRGWAHEQFDADEVRKRMYENGTYSSNVPGDEVPEAYKDVQLIENQIQPTAEVVDRLKPVMNFKK